MTALLGATIQPWMLALAGAVLLAGLLMLFLGTRRRTRATDAAEVVETDTAEVVDGKTDTTAEVVDGADIDAPDAAADRTRTAEAGTGRTAASDPDPKV